MSPATLDVLLRSLLEELERLLARMDPTQRAAIEAELRALRDAIQALRAAIASGAGNVVHLMRAVFEALDRLIDAMRAAGMAALVRGSEVLRSAWVLLEMYGAGGAGGGAAGGAGGVVLAELLVVLALLLAAILAWIKSANEILIAKGPVAPPVGGMLCAGPNPVARGLTAGGWSLWGEHRAFKDAEANARTAAQGVTCPPAGTCTTGTCRGNCAITDVRYAWRLLWTRCTVTFDVYCECY